MTYLKRMKIEDGVATGDLPAAHIYAKDTRNFLTRLFEKSAVKISSHSYMPNYDLAADVGAGLPANYTAQVYAKKHAADDQWDVFRKVTQDFGGSGDATIDLIAENVGKEDVAELIRVFEMQHKDYWAVARKLRQSGSSLSSAPSP